MAVTGGFIRLCSLAALVAFTAAGDETLPLDCGSQAQLLERISADVEVAVECGLMPPLNWSSLQTASLLLTLKNLTDAVHQHQLTECRGAAPKECGEAKVPENGGLACVTVANKRYCKPMCNDGYDFAFMRTSRLYDHCSEQAGHRWDTQYIGGNTLAVCNKSVFQVAGAKTAYFPKGQNCLTTKKNIRLRDSVMEEFKTELKNDHVIGQPQFDCLVCG